MRAPWSVPACVLVLFGLVPACDSFDFGRVFGTTGGRTSEQPSPTASAPPVTIAPKRQDRLTVVAAGDIALGGNVRSWLEADKAYTPLSGLAPVFDDADLRFASLISPISDKPARGGKPGTPVGPPQAANAFARARVDVLAIANEELWSAGSGPFADTLANLARAKIAVAGTVSSPDALEATELHVQGWSIALFAVTTWPKRDPGHGEGRDRVAIADPARLARAIHEARAHHDLVLVSHHGGPLGGESPDDEQIAVARAAIDAGADAVFDHRAHVPFGVGWISGHPVFYGLGNLVADEDPKDPWTARSFLARIRFSRAGSAEVDACPYLIADGEPKLLSDPGRMTQEGVFRRAIVRLSESLGGTEVGDPDPRSCMKLTPDARPVSDSSAPR